MGRLAGFVLLAVLACVGVANAQSWRPAPTFPGLGAGTAILRPNGVVFVEEVHPTLATGNWFLLRPDVNGNYDTGSWEPIDSLPAGYTPTYFASAVLPDGRVIVEGGEFNGSGIRVVTDMGAIYNFDGTWSSVAPPKGWTNIGDAPSVVLPDGSFMVGSCCRGLNPNSKQQAILTVDGQTLTWKETGGGKQANAENGWTLLPNGKVLTVDTGKSLVSELYNPETGEWSKTGSLVEAVTGCETGEEIGPAVLRPNGTVFQAGANGKTAIYDSATGTWSKGPSFPINSSGHGQDGVADGPAALLPNGNVLVMASKVDPCWGTPSDFYVFDGTDLDLVPGPPNADTDLSYNGRMVELPSGHILFTDGTQDVEIFFPGGRIQDSWRPTITSYPKTVSTGVTYTIKGTQFNGFSQGAAYGDDAQMASNFPLVRVKNNASGHVFYAFTANFSTMGVATGKAVVSADFTMTSGESGASTLVVVANGIPSNPVDITVKVP